MAKETSRREVLKGGVALAGLGALGVPEWAFPALAQGETLVEFDTESLEADISGQAVTVARAAAALSAQQRRLADVRSKSRRNISAAKLAVETATLDLEEFQEMTASGRLLEWALVYGHNYGTGREFVEQQLAQGRDVLLDIDVQGARSVSRELPESHLIFVLPPSFKTLKRRLESRRLDDREAILSRLRNARSEMLAFSKYDYLILNEDIEETNKKLEASEGDRTFLERELLRLQDEKAELVKKMNDIEFVTAQYQRIKSDINVARRLDWMRRGIGHYAKDKTITEKFVELRRPDHGATLAGIGEPLPDKIQVELTSNGEVKINGKIVAPKEAEETPEQPEANTPVAPTPVPTPAPGQD